MAEVAEMAASTGIDLKAAKQYIWGLYQANDMASVETWAAQIAPRQAGRCSSPTGPRNPTRKPWSLTSTTPTPASND